MFLPLTTDRPPKRRPIVNELLIVTNLLVYLIGVMGFNFDWFDREAIARVGHFVMAELDSKPWQLITYQFIHDPHGIWHILFNLIFLWVFGNAVESRLGRIGYLGFYLTAGIVAGLAHGILYPNTPVIGASGAIAGVSGAFLALFPRARVKILFFFFVIGIFSIPAAWFILFYFVLDLLNQVLGLFGGSDQGVAYAAHLAGYVYGFSTGFALLALRILKREEFDIFYLFQQGQRRRTFRATARQSPGVWDQPRASTSDGAKKTRRPRPMTEQEMEIADARAEISRLLAAEDIEAATSQYRQLLKRSPGSTLPEPRQLDLANAFYRSENVEDATRAYELFLQTYPNSRDANQVRLILAMIYTRRQRNAERARQLLQTARPKLAAASEQALADQLLSELEGAS